MKSLLNFIIKYHYFILFILIECFSIILVISYSDYHRATFLNSSIELSGKLHKVSHSVSQYLDLKTTNERLNQTLVHLMNHSDIVYKQKGVASLKKIDSLYIKQYHFIPGQVVNNSISRQNNFIVLDIGKRCGVKKEQGVISSNGIVGVVKDRSDNFTSVISVLNRNLRISAMIKHSGYFGSLYWDGVDYRYVVMDDLPNHISVAEGDTIITSGYSAIFPKGILIGVVSKVNESKEGAFMSVLVKLSVDFSKLSHVMVVKNFLREEQLNIEKELRND
jgi:rod shape-determining protein MreC